jgi:aryl-alcohol dehydrogenase-like predicted oxidoreductase
MTISHSRRHRDLEAILKKEDLDFVQLTYNLTHRSVEDRLLPGAKDHGISVIVNRPYDGGNLIRNLQRRHSVPEWTKAELDCQTWADVLIKFLVSHPAVTCAIPATTRVEHLRENMRAGRGSMPDAKQRQRMIQDIERL